MAAPHNSPFRDRFGRYCGPLKIKTAAVLDPAPYDDLDRCVGCHRHAVDGHEHGCPYRGAWD
ncbi:hypothetical protein PBI_NEWMAN_71 [Mycobacterium phage Newman]|uniref:Uncharacterized protein n=3 Tax=Pegunavirus suffolk TaxID=1986540 RepID=L7TJ62_9CAUD|nr:hypothetical protein M046_gp71 [Mycobacterium phage Newman]AEJ95257.1 hypothetical protein KLUCKY39_71 [Mycobacterium phage KLucky39]AGC34025.1 hypothetical protein Nacho_0076 [Mycobacterium phage Nacho]AGM13268.1 hypothetical protein PBI_NEWMAN_71 [Mycobacterium phage Newman]QNO12285.1 hypothetical protein SEA_DIRTJUICE_73 [Mycobacterium phage DirtJuice]